MSSFPEPTLIHGSWPERTDICVFGPHPDDADLGAGGVLLKARQEGKITAIVDMTRGELGSRGTVEDRKNEAVNAAKLLGVNIRCNLDMGDGRLEVNTASCHHVASILRRLRPTLVIAPYPDDKHPDHGAGGQIITNALFHARMKMIDLGQPIWSPRGLLYYVQHWYRDPTFVVDITGVFKEKQAVIRAFETQFGSPLTNIGNDYMPLGTYDYQFFLESRARQFGNLIRKAYGEGFLTAETLEIEDPLTLFEGR